MGSAMIPAKMDGKAVLERARGSMPRFLALMTAMAKLAKHTPKADAWLARQYAADKERAKRKR
jgi:hypothetical protein